jgi:glycosyltransferase involved in cell wall biosynthesis
VNRILILIPNLGLGGAQKVFHYQLQYLAQFFDVEGCVFNWNGALPSDRQERIASLDVPAGHSIVHKIYCFILRIHRLRRLKKEKNITVTISHLEGADYINILSRGQGKVICWIHGTKKFDGNIKGGLGWFRKKMLMPLLYPKADRIVTVSDGIAMEIRKNLRGLDSITKTIYNGFDVNRIVKQSDELPEPEFIDLSRAYKLIVTHCRLSRQKNLHSLFHIYKRLDVRKETKLIIIGDGELRPDILELCDQLGLTTWTVWDKNVLDSSKDVYFLGHQDNPFKYLSRSLLYVMTSNWEGFPLALCEAIICKLCIVTTDCFTGPREILAPEFRLTQPVEKPYHSDYGILMPLVSVSNAVAMKMWIREIENVISGKTRTIYNYPVRRFDISESMRQTKNLIDEALR